MEWAKTYFRPANRWPAGVVGGFAKRVRETNLSDLRTYHYCTLNQATATPVRDPGIAIRAAMPDDLAEIERLFVSRGRVVLLQADDLCVNAIDLRRVSALYDDLGLTRRREILIAEKGGAIAGFALLEITSPGINFSELTNTFTLHLWEKDSALRQALIARAVRCYRELGYPQAIALVETEDLADFQALGFQSSKEYTCWTWHRSLMRPFYEHIVRLFARWKTAEDLVL